MVYYFQYCYFSRLLPLFNSKLETQCFEHCTVLDLIEGANPRLIRYFYLGMGKDPAAKMLCFHFRT
jgi:hypothetical protein